MTTRSEMEVALRSIGVVFALSLVLFASRQWLREPTLLPAMILGLATVAIPFLVMQPSFGLAHCGFEDAQPYSIQIPKPHEPRCVWARLIHFSAGH